ncbi:hypothetical protein C8J57DRAFT_1253651 [Mycena rebaudengoi]|nr:hypothetical protein C8J57DRAFT_1253651 [Mycena rebaudengoi]
MHKAPKARKWAPCSKRAATSWRASVPSHFNVGRIPANIFAALRRLLRVHTAPHAQKCANAQMCGAQLQCVRNALSHANACRAARTQPQCMRNAPTPRKCTPHSAHTSAAAENTQMRTAPHVRSCKQALRAQGAEIAKMRTAYACTRRRKREKARPAARAQPIKHGRGKGNSGGGTFDGLMGR